jgi:hypothetical protein
VTVKTQKETELREIVKNLQSAGHQIDYFDTEKSGENDERTACIKHGVAAGVTATQE